MHDIAVLTPSYAYGRFIEDAIRSVLGQEDIDCEQVIQDGDSKDETVDILKQFSERVTWESKPDHGQSDALNMAIARAQGRWIGWLNADEFYLPNALAALVKVGDKSAADVVYGDAIFVDAEGRFLRLLPQHPFSQLVLKWYGIYMPTCASIFRRQTLGHSPWDTSLRLLLDWDVTLKLLAARAHFVYVPLPIAAFRVHPDRVSAEPSSTFQAEFALMQRRHGVPSRRMRSAVGNVIHGMHKLMHGAYVRQVKARGLAGTDIRWFRHDVGISSYEKLLEMSYRKLMNHLG